MAGRAFALDVSIGQEHALDRIVELLDVARADEPSRLQAFVYILRQLDVFGRVGGMPVVKLDLKAVEVSGSLCRISGNQLLGRNAFGFGLEHDRRPMGVVRSEERRGGKEWAWRRAAAC